MGKRAKDPEEWESIGIMHGRLNGLKLETVKQNRRTPGNTLDTILQKDGIKVLTDDQLEKELAKVGKVIEKEAPTA